MSSKTLRVGYVPLTDAAVLIAAAARGFAEEEDLALELVREVSWANIRDKLIIGMFDAAHMLAPFAIATSLGAGHIKVPLIAPVALNLNGNAITVSTALNAEVTSQLGHEPPDPVSYAKAVGEAARRRRARGAAPLTFGVVFPFSTHTYLLRHWLRQGGVDLEHDIQLAVVPPPYMADSLNSGLLDGFCVGSPWNSLAVEAGVGRIAAFGVEIARRAPEKILAIQKRTHDTDPETTFRLVRALVKAARWCAIEENHKDLSRLVAGANYLNLPAPLVHATLSGSLHLGGQNQRSDKDFLILGRSDTNRPDPRHAIWLYAEMVHAKQTVFSPEECDAAASVYRPDIYDAAIDEARVPDEVDPVQLTCGPGFIANTPALYLTALDSLSR